MKTNPFPFPGRASTIALAACAALLAGGPATAGSLRYQVQELATPNGSSSWSFANDINNLGQVAGFVQTGDTSTRRAAVWDGSQTLKLVLGDASFSEAYALNNAGQAVGWVSYTSGQTRAALWNGTQLDLLDTAGAWQDRAVGINDSGLVVGSVIASNGYQHAAAWSGGRLTDLGATTVRGDAFSTAASVNRWGEITGSATVPGSTSGHLPLTWADYGAGYTVQGSYNSIAINDLGQVLSIEDVGSGDNHVFVPILMQGGQSQHMLPGNAEGYFFKLNNAGQAIGVTHGQTASLWSTSGGAVAISGVLLPGSTTVANVTAINDYGQIAGYTSNHKAAVLTPTGTLHWSGPSGGAFNEAANWDSGLGLAPNKFLDAEIAAAGTIEVVGVGYDLAVKSLTVGGGGGINTLFLIEGGRIDALAGTRLLAGGRLAVSAGSDAIFATGHLGGDLTMFEGSGIVLEAGRPLAGSFDRLVIDGRLAIGGGDFILSLDGDPVHAGDSYDFLDFGATSGHFSHLVLPTLADGLYWDSSRLYSDGILSVQAVPEPSGMVLMLFGLAGLAWAKRRSLR